MGLDFELLDSSGNINTFDWQAFFLDMADQLLSLALKLAYGIVILIVGWIVVSILLAIIRRVLKKLHWDETLKRWLVNVVNVLLKVVLFTIVIGSIGIEVMSFTALISAMGMAIGLALSGIVQNFMAGVMIIALKPIRVGEWIRVSGVEGVVQDTAITFTTIVSFNRQAHIIPNDSIINGVVTNFSRKDKRRLDLSFTISYREDIDRARDAVLTELLTDERVLRTPRPLVTVEEVDGAQIKLNVMPWIKTPDPFQYMGILWDMYGHILDGIQKCDIAVGTIVEDAVYHFGPAPDAPKPREKTVFELEQTLIISDRDSDSDSEHHKKHHLRIPLRRRKHKKLGDAGAVPGSATPDPTTTTTAATPTPGVSDVDDGDDDDDHGNKPAGASALPGGAAFDAAASAAAADHEETEEKEQEKRRRKDRKKKRKSSSRSRSRGPTSGDDSTVELDDMQ